MDGSARSSLVFKGSARGIKLEDKRSGDLKVRLGDLMTQFRQLFMVLDPTGLLLTRVSYSIPDVDCQGSPCFSIPRYVESMVICSGTMLGHVVGGTFYWHFHALWKNSDGSVLGGHIWNATVEDHSNMNLCWTADGPQFRRGFIGNIPVWVPDVEQGQPRLSVEYGKDAVGRRDFSFWRSPPGTAINEVISSQNSVVGSARACHCIGSLWTHDQAGGTSLVEILGINTNSPNEDDSLSFLCVDRSGTIVEVDAADRGSAVAVVFDLLVFGN